MPENVLEPVISKRYGVPIPDNQLPLDYDRRILIDRAGCCSIAYFEKHTKEVFDYYIDAMRWLEPNEFIIGASAWTDSAALLVTRVEYATTGIVAWLANGANRARQTVTVELSTNLGKVKLVKFILRTQGLVSKDFVLVTGEGDEVLVGSSAPVQPDPTPIITIYPSSLVFPLTAAIAGQSTKNLVIKNDGTGPAHIENLFIDGPFTQTNSGITTLAPGQFIQIAVSYNPVTTGQHTGFIEAVITDHNPVRAILEGTADSANRITVVGNQFVLTSGQRFKIKAVNWHGAESTKYVPLGLDVRSYKDLVAQIKAMGFNAVRLAFSGDVCSTTRQPAIGAINTVLNPTLQGKTAIEVLGIIIDYLDEHGVYVILDHHRRAAGTGSDGSPFSDTYALNDWKASWRFMVDRYSSFDFVLGANLHNQPYQLEWDEWSNAAKVVGDSILGVAKHWIIFVDGVETHGANTYWRGGELSGVRGKPVKLSIDGRLAYCTHEYGQSTAPQPWLAKDSAVPLNWPLNLYAEFRKHWGFIVEENIAPVLIAGVGGQFGVNGTGQISTSASAQYERQWIYHLQRYMGGYYDGTNNNPLPIGAYGVSFAYWALSPVDVNIGGILQDDWATAQQFKLEVIGMMLNNAVLSSVLGLSPMAYNAVENGSQLVISQNGEDYAIPFSDLTDAMRLRLYDVGEVHFFSQAVNVAARYAGQVWARVDGADKVIRIAKANDSNILASGGSNTITVAKANLPAVQIDVTGTISSTDIGSKTTSFSGGHTHSYDKLAAQTSINVGQGGNVGNSVVSADTGISGDHSHTVAIGSHAHTLSDAKTAALGSGTSIDVTNEYITLAAWYRVS